MKLLVLEKSESGSRFSEEDLLQPKPSLTYIAFFRLSLEDLLQSKPIRQLAKEQNRAEALSAEALELSTQLQQTTQAYNGLTHLLDKGTHEEDISREGSSTMESSKICFCIPRHKNSHKVDGGSEKSSKSKPSRRKSGAKEGKHSSSSDSSGNGNTGAASAAGSAAAVAAIAVTAVTMDAVDEDDGGSTHVHGGEGGGGGGGD